MQTNKKYTSLKEKRENERIRKMPDSSPILLVIYLIGITGLLFALNDLMHLSSPQLYTVIFLSCLFSSILWYIYTHRTRHFRTIVMFFCLIAVLYCLTQSQSLMRGYYSIVTSQGIPSSSVPMVILLSATTLLLIFTLEFISRNHSIMFLLCGAVLVLGTFIGIAVTPLTAIMILIYMFGFVVLNPSGNSLKKLLSSTRSARTAAISCITAAAVIAAAFIPALLVENKYHYDILSRIYIADGQIQDLIIKLSNNLDIGVTDGSVSRGNLHQTGEKMFTAEIVNQPQQPIYVKSFTGSYYNGTNWDSAYWIIGDDASLGNNFIDLSKTEEESDYEEGSQEISYYREEFVNDIIKKQKRDYFEKVAKNVKDTAGFTMTKAMYDPENKTIYFNTDNGSYMNITADGLLTVSLPEYSNNQTEDSPFRYKCEPLPEYPEKLFSASSSSDPVSDIYTWDVGGDLTTSGKGNTINITPEENKNVERLSPYYARHTSSSEEEYMYGGPVNYSYYDYFKYQTTMEESYKDGSAQTALAPYRSFIDDYYNECLDKYTYVPYENMPRLTKLCAEMNLTDINEITTFILYTLQNHASYSTTPGSVPNNKDTIEYFLFENHKGYCVHFATAAVLMYRLFGIPARYATGYVLNDTMFTETGDAGAEIKNAADYRYRADVTDHNAHAWAEIFLKDYGWVPVEVTPTIMGTMAASYPGYGYTEMNKIMQKYGWKFSSSSSSRSGAAANAGGENNFFSADSAIFILLGAAAAAVLLFFPVRRAVIMRKEKDMTCEKLYGRLIRCLHYCRRLKEYNGSEEDFAKSLSDSLITVSPEEAELLVGIMQQLHYSPDPITEQDRENVYRICRCAMDELYDSSPWYRKIPFRFVKGYK